MTKTVEEVAAALRAHRDSRKADDAGHNNAGCLAFIAPKVDVTMSTCIGNFTAVIPVAVDDSPGRLVMRYGEDITFVQHDNRHVAKATPLNLSSEKFGGDGARCIEALRGVAKDINAFCDAVELVWRGGEPK